MISKRLIAAVGAGTVAGALGVTLAGGALTAGASTGTTGAAGATTKTHAGKGPHRGQLGRFGELGRVLHGEGVVKTKTGFETIAVDRGTVTAVTPTSITITSADKVAETFTNVATSKVRLDGKKSTFSAAKVGDRAGALAVKTSTGTLDIKTLILRDGAAKSAAGASGPSA